MIEAIAVAKVGAVVAGTAGAAYLIADYIMHKDSPTSRPIVSRAVGAVADTVSPGDVPAVKVGMPLYTDADRRTIIDSPLDDNTQLQGISALANQILCDGRSPLGGDVLATFASCESQTGSLRNACYNCSLFNVHWYSSCGYPSVRVGGEKVISFVTGAPSQVEGFRRCLQHFKGFLERKGEHGEAAKRALMAGDFDAFQIAIGSMNYSSGYTNTVQGGRIIGSHFMQARYQRLVAAGLL